MIAEIVKKSDRFLKLTEEEKKAVLEELSIIYKQNLEHYFYTLYIRKILIKNPKNSFVLYCLGLTDIKPTILDISRLEIKRQKSFSMPDFDIDFDKEKRKLVIDYITNKYGKNKVVFIGTINYIKSLCAIRDAARVLDIPKTEQDYIIAILRKYYGNKFTLKDIINDQIIEIQELIKKYNFLFQIALKFEGLPRQPGIHAAGLVITPIEAYKIFPVYFNAAEEKIVSVLTKNELEKLGLIKVDILGLKTLTILDAILKKLKKRGIDLDLFKINLKDQKTWNLISSGKTLGCFQFETPSFQKILRQIKINSIEEAAHIQSLNRPGPISAGILKSYINRKLGLEKITYMHDLVASELESTLGLCIFQEQIMSIAKILANYSVKDTSRLRKIISKYANTDTGRELMNEEKNFFIKGCKTNNIDEETAIRIFDQLEKFGGYSFNKSHAVAYSLIMYYTAYLKTNYPLEFFSTIFSYNADDLEKLNKYIIDAKSFNIKILPPDINESNCDFTPIYETNSILFGLNAIKGLGEKTINKIITNRRYSSIFEVFKNPNMKLNIKDIRALIYAGALDKFSHRSILVRDFLKINLEGYDMLKELASKEKEYLGINIRYGKYYEK